MADAHGQPESSTVYFGPPRINMKELKRKVLIFLDDEEEAHNSRKKAFTDKIQEKARREGKNEREIQAHICAAEFWTMVYRTGRVNSLFHDFEEKMEEERAKKKDKIEKDKIEKYKIKKDEIEKDEIEKDEIEKDEIEKDEIEEDEIEKDEIKKDEIKEDKNEKDGIEKEKIEKEKIEKERNVIENPEDPFDIYLRGEIGEWIAC